MHTAMTTVKPVPLPQETRTVVWMMGRDDKVVTWDLGKIGVLANFAKVQPEPGERWTVRVIRDTAPGERKGVLVLDPIEKLADDQEPPPDSGVEVDEPAVENAGALVDLVVASLCPEADVDEERTDHTVRYKIIPPEGQETALMGLDGTVIESLRTLVRHITSKAGVRAWVDIQGTDLYASCDSCGERFVDPMDYEDHTGPGGAEERFEVGGPVKYAYRICQCGGRVYIPAV